MGSAKTFAHANAIIEAYLRTGTVYLGLASAVTNGDAGAVTELSGSGYARQAIAFSAPVNGVTSNTGTLVFPNATAPWLPVTHGLVYTQASGGTLLYYGALQEPKTIAQGERLELAPGAVVIEEL